jgi:hypothetical protein
VPAGYLPWLPFTEMGPAIECHDEKNQHRKYCGHNNELHKKIHHCRLRFDYSRYFLMACFRSG